MRKISVAIAFFLFIACNYNTYKQGKDLYESNCAQCHMPDGTGVGDLYPALTKLGPDYDYGMITCYILNGKKSENSLLEMVAIKGLTDIEINNIINYVRAGMNGLKGEVSIADTRKLIPECTE